MKVSIYNPARQMGGSDILLANLAVLISGKPGFDVDYIEFSNGPTVEYVKKNNSQCNILHVENDGKIHIEEGIVILILLHAKLLGKTITLGKNVRLAFWSTHPEDGIKILPLFNLFYKKNEPYRRIIANLTTPIQKAKTKKFFEVGTMRKGIIWMDNCNYDYNKYFYDLKGTLHTYWPLITSDPLAPIRNNYKIINERPINICILGRVIDFKIIPLFDLLPTIVSIKPKIKFHIIGTGEFVDALKNKFDHLGFKYNFIGHIPKDQLDFELLKYDIILGMGTSVLESAKLGIPSMVMNGSYSKLKPQDLKYEWLYNCPPGFVGEEISFKNNNILTRDFITLFEEFYYKNETIGNACYKHWEKYYSQHSFLSKVTQDLSENTMYYHEIKPLLNLNLVNRLVNKLKNLLSSKKGLIK